MTTTTAMANPATALARMREFCVVLIDVSWDTTANG